MTVHNRMLKTVLRGSNSWPKIHSKLIEYNERGDPRAGKLFERFCKHYFLCEPSVRREFKNVWLEAEVPSKVRRKLTMAKRDYGVDLVLQHQDGRLFAVQCKFRTNERASLSWTKDRLSSWLSEADAADGLILFTNAAKIDSHTHRKARKKDFSLYTGGDLRRLDTATIALIRQSAAGQDPKEVERASPRPYQRTAINEVTNGFRAHSRGQLILPCGAGKTLTALWIKEQLRAKRTLVLVPSLALLRQTREEWAAHQNGFTPYLCVCSDKTVDLEKRRDQTVVQTYEVHGRVTTKAADVRAFLFKNKKAIVYSTYQSLDVVQRAMKGTKLLFDLTLCDEAHKTAGDRKGDFGRVHDQAFPTKRRLYMTATPKVTAQKVKTRLGEDTFKLLADMSDEETFGPIFHRMSFADAIARKILTDYKIVVIGVSNAEMKRAVQTRRWTKDATIDEVANNFALHKVMRKYKAHHAISFHSTVNRAKAFRDRHTDFYPKIHTAHVNGSMSTNGRAVLLDDFKSETAAILTNARCLTEGIDVPAIDCVYFCDPKSSKIDIVQASGRALRLPKGGRTKNFGYIVVPIFHKSRKDVENAVEKSVFKHVVEVVRALADQDERLQAEIHQLVASKGKRSSSGRRINIDLGRERLILTGFESALRRSLFDQLIERTTTRWDQRIIELVAYKNKFRSLRVSRDANEPWAELGEWVHGVRADKRNGRMSEERIKQLEALDFDWKVDGETLESVEGLITEAEFIKRSGLSRVSDLRRQGKIKPIGWYYRTPGLLPYYRPDQVDKLKKKLGITLDSTAGLISEKEFGAKAGLTRIASYRKQGKIRPVGYAMTKAGVGPYYRESQIEDLRRKLGITLKTTKGLVTETELAKAVGVGAPIIAQLRKSGSVTPAGYHLSTGTGGPTAYYRPSAVTQVRKRLGITLPSSDGLLNESEFREASGLYQIAKYREQGLIKPHGVGVVANGRIRPLYHPSQIAQLREKLGITLATTEGLLHERQARDLYFSQLSRYRKQGLIEPVGRAMTRSGLGYYYDPKDLERLKTQLGITLDSTKGLLSERQFAKRFGWSEHRLKEYRKEGLIRPEGFAFVTHLTPFYHPRQNAELKKAVRRKQEAEKRQFDTPDGLLAEHLFAELCGLASVKNYRKRGQIKPARTERSGNGHRHYYRPDQAKAFLRKLGVTLRSTDGLLTEKAFREASGLDGIHRYRRQGILTPRGIGIHRNGRVGPYYHPDQIEELRDALAARQAELKSK